MKRLLDILACPACKATLERQQDELLCSQAGHRFPIVNGVPILFPDGSIAKVEHEADLVTRTGYDPWLHRNVLQSLTGSHIVLDIGAGNMMLDDPCIIRMDVTLTPYVDIVGDAHALPFRDESLDYVLSLAVLEHLRQPFVAGQEMYRVLKRGGYVYCDTNFVFAYHGYPHHYFNSTLHGIEQVFAAFTKLYSGVAPYQMPSYAIENILSVYLQHFMPTNSQEVEFVQSAQQVLSYPLRTYDSKFTQDVAYRLSAGVCYLGIKQINPSDTVLPKPIMDVYTQDQALTARFPNPVDITVLDNLMTWARREGHTKYPEISDCLDSAYTFSKYWDDRPISRTWIENLPWGEPHPVSLKADEQSEPVQADVPSMSLPTPWWKLPGKALSILVQNGPRALIKNILRYLEWRVGPY